MARLGQIGLDDDHVFVVAEPSLPQLLADVEQMLLVLDLEDDGVGSLGNIAVGRTFPSRMHDLRGLETPGEVGPDDDVVVKGTPHNQKGGKWGKVRGSRCLRRKLGLIQATNFRSESKVRGPFVGSTAVVVRSS